MKAPQVSETLPITNLTAHHIHQKNPTAEKFALSSECIVCASVCVNLIAIHAAEWGHTALAAAKKGRFRVFPLSVS
jgi:hypothetical protein